MKSHHVKTTVIGTSAVVLIGVAVYFLTRSSHDSRSVVSQKADLTQSPAKSINEKSQVIGPESFRMTPLPPMPPPTPQITSVPKRTELDTTRELQQASSLPINDPLVVTASANLDWDAEPSSLSPTPNVRQAGHRFPSKDSPSEPQPALGGLSSLTYWDENSPQDALEDSEASEYPKDLDDLKDLDDIADLDDIEDLDNIEDLDDSEDITDLEAATPEPSSLDEKSAKRLADESQSAPPAQEAVGWTTGLLFEQIRSQRATTAQHEIRWSLNDAIMAALIYSNRISTLRIEPIEELQNVGVQSGQFDIVGFAEQSFRDSAEPVGSTIDTATGVQPIIQEQDLNLVYGLRQQLRTGGEIELNQSFQTRDNDSGILMPRDQVISRFNARLTKELLRGAGRSIAMNEVLVAFHDASAQRAESVGEIADHLNEVMTAYWDIFAARGALFASMENRQLAIEVLQELQARQDIDAEQNLLDQAEATIRQRELQINEANNDLARAQIRLVSLVNAPELLKNLQAIEIMPQVSPDLEARGLDIASRVNTAIQRRPEVADIIQQIKSAQVTNHVSLNDLLPRLSLSLEASLNGLEGDRQTAAAFGNQFENDITYQVGASVEVPFANRQARYNRRRTELIVERLKATWQMTVEQVKADVLDNAQEFSASQIRLQKQQEILQFSGSELRYLGLRKTVAPKETSNPSFELTQLLAAQDRQGTAKADYIAAVADKHRSIFELNRATGILINADVIPTVGGPPRPGLFSVYHQYIEERSVFADPAIALESQTRAEAKQHRRPGIKQILHSRSHGVDHHAPIQHAPIPHAPIQHAPIQETPRYPLYRRIP